jgi:glucose/arabinose dehydrogenase
MTRVGRGALDLALSLAALAITLGFHSQHAAAALRLEPVLSGLNSPVFVTSARDGTNRLFIIERGGRILVLGPGASAPTVFLDISAKVLSTGGEQGLLGLAFHPRYSSNRRFFVNYTRKSDGATVVAEYRASSDPDVAGTAEAPILVIDQPFANHNGGMLAFGPGGRLFIGMGDGGSGNDPDDRAQNIDDLLGKLLRIDIDGAAPYTSPSTNPFVGTDGRDEIFALGFRNPWRFSFDRVSGTLYVGDVGQSEREEIDVVTRGANYGWRVLEGNRCTGLGPAACSDPTFKPPVLDYDHGGGRCAVTGGYAYRGTSGTLPQGTYVFADFCSGEIWRLAGAGKVLLFDTDFLVSSFGEDEAGEIYVVDLRGAVYRLAADSGACTYSLSSSSIRVSTAAQSASMGVFTTAGCAWSAVSNAPWIRVTGGSTGSGNGTVRLAIAAHTGRQPRTGTVSIADKTFTVVQSGTGSCGGRGDPCPPGGR